MSYDRWHVHLSRVLNPIPDIVFALVLASVSVLCVCERAIATGPSTDEFAEAILSASGCGGGMVAIVGRTKANLAMSLASQGPFTVHCLSGSEEQCIQLRTSIQSRGLYGQVSAASFDGRWLPYTDNSMNLVVIDSYPRLQKLKGGMLEEVERVLVPLGTAFFGASSDSQVPTSWAGELVSKCRDLGLDAAVTDRLDGVWVRVRKPWPSDIDEWTHFLHGADGNPVARDLVVGPPRHYQWTSGPAWLRSHETDSSVSTMVTSQGRLFCIMDEAPISLPGNHSLPDKWALVARDAFNGVLLWRVPIRRWGWREWKNTWFSNRPGDFPLNIRKRLVATGEDVFVTLGYHAPVSRIDAKTGEILETYAGTEGTGEILHVNDTLILAVLAEDGVRILAVDPETGVQRWQTDAVYRGTTVDYLRWPRKGTAGQPTTIDPAMNLATDGNVVALTDGPEIVCLDFRSGEQKWRTRFPTDDADLHAGGINSRGDLWVGTMIVCDGVVIHASPHQLAAFSQETGELLWSQPKKYIGHLWYEWKDVFVIDDLVWTWSSQLDRGTIDVGKGKKQRQQWPHAVNGYHIRTGELKKEVELGSIFRSHHHHRCYRNKATSRYILASRRGTEFVDLVNGRHTVDNWVRGTCHVGMMPANGLQYAPPHPCKCYMDEKLIGMNALASSVVHDGNVIADSDRLSKGPAWGRLESGKGDLQAQSDLDWPAFRHDAARTGSIESSVATELSRLWRRKLGTKISPPISVADQVFVSLVDEHQVVTLDSHNGKEQWRFTAGGRIDSPPTFYRGRIIVGSADGTVYCLNAKGGQLVWKFAAAPCQRLIGVDGQLESAWPVHGSVLIQNGLAYFAAGRSSQLDGGIYLFALDPMTGQLLHTAKLDGPHYTVDNVQENYNLPMGALTDVLMGNGTNVFMRTRAFDAKLNPTASVPDLQPPSGFLEDSYFKRAAWTFRGGDYARLIVHDTRSVYYVRMFDSLRGLDPTVFFTPGRKGYLLFAKDLGGKRDAWRLRVPVRIRAMVLAGESLFVAGPPDVVDPKDPLGAFEGRRGGQLHVFDGSSGASGAEHVLPSPPVFNGMAAANGHLFVADEQGYMTCFGQP